jgi:hypothetical protein
MKSKISKILGVGLTAALLTGLVLAAAPASASTLSWGSGETIPSEVNDVLIPGEDILDIAACGEAVYAVAGTANKTYKSTNTGVSWKELSSVKATTSFPNSNMDLVVVAPDDADVVAVVTYNGTAHQVEYSVNGGSSWTNLGAPATGAEIQCIDMSADASGYRYLAVGGNTSGSATMYTLKLATGESWTQRASTSNGFAASQDMVNAVKFSPNFATDKIITCVSSDTSANSATLQVMWYESPYKWNG